MHGSSAGAHYTLIKLVHIDSSHFLRDPQNFKKRRKAWQYYLDRPLSKIMEPSPLSNIKGHMKLIVEIYSNSASLLIAIGKVFLMIMSKNANKTHKGDTNWPLFVNKQLFCWSASITLDNGYHFSYFKLYYMPRLTWLVVFLMLFQF